MPGYIATNIVGNSMRAFGLTDEAEIEKANAGWQENAPTSAAEAAAIILDGVRSGDLADPGRRGREEAGRVRARERGVHL